MILKKNILILVSVMLFLAFSSFVLAGNCCVPQYEDLSAGLSFTNVTAANSPPQGQGDCDSLLPYFPNTPFIFDTECIDIGTGCCCNQYGGVALTGIDDTPSVYKYYCKQANPNYVFNDQIAVQNSGYTTCQSYCTSGSPSSYNLTGYVSYQGNGSMLPGATINVLDSGLTAVTNNAGQYQLNGVLNGWNSFEVSVAPIYVLNGDNLTCNVTSEYLFIGEDREINFTLDCIPNQEICEPYWVTGEWGPCVPYGNTAVQFREVTDLNDCNTSVNRPASVNISACEGVTLNDCGNGLIDGTERCDINKTSGDEIYILPSGGTSESRPNCKDFFPDVYDSGEISCTDTCNYDYSDCQGCGPICSQPSQCGCDVCAGDPLCGNPCDTVKPNFLDAFTDRESKRNVHDLYQEIKSDPKRYSEYDYGVHYFEGTNDVMIEWNYNDSCKNTIMGYKLSICEEDPDKPNFCKSGGEYNEFVVEGADMGQEHFRMSNVLQENTSYCYNVCAVGINKATLCAANESEKLVCFKTGDEYCMTPHEPGLNCEFVTVGETQEYVPHGCVYDAYAYTNLSNEIQECDLGTTCVETNYDPSNGLYGANCHATAECDYCNGIFGLYGAYDLHTLIDGNSQKCSNLLYKKGDNPPAENSVVGLCYKDASLTPEPVYKDCKEVHSCYDYTSKEACENDYCYAFTNSSHYNDCQWKYLDEETDIGVCSPKTDELQNCRACDSNSLLGFCDEDICSLYGDCYYKDELNHGVYNMSYRPFYDTSISSTSLEESYLEYFTPYTTAKTHPTCLNKNEMSCYMYENEEDCTGGIKLSIDIVHNPDLFNTSNFNNTILYGTNKILNSSNDSYHFGDCEWNPEQTSLYKNTFGCQKNADGVYNFHSAPNKYSNQQDDCVDFGLDATTDYSKCLQDNTPPETTLVLRPGEEQEQYKSESGDYLPVYGRYEIANIDYSTTDNIWDSTDIDTRVSFISLEKCSQAHCLPSVDCPSCDEKNIAGMQACYALGCELYPQHSFSEFLDDETLSERVITNGEHIMTYYSKDPARNLEEVHYKRIYIDTSKPEIINFTKNISSFKLAEDIYATNLSINFSTTEPALCHGTLYLQRPDGSNRTHPSGDFIIANKTSFRTSYRELPDGDYEFYINCSDTYQNEVQQVESFRIEGDASIANPWPRGQVFRDVEDVLLSLETQNNASCKLSFMDNLSYAQSPTTFEETGGMNHTHHFYPLEVSGNTSGVYIYYTSCLFDNGSVTEQQASDVISFTMDRLAPTTKLTVYDSDVDDYVEYDPSSASYTDEKDFKLICNDTNYLIPIRTFNCANISYCFGPGLEDLTDFTPENNCMNGELLSGEGNELDLTAQFIQDAGYFIYYFSSDKGSNVENIHMANMKIRDTSFVVPPYFEIITN